MSLLWCIQAGRFDDGFAVGEPLDRAAVAGVLERFADRDASGQPVPGRHRPRLTAWVELGFVEKVTVLFRATGVVEVNFLGSGPRLNGFLVALCRELHCRLLAPDSFEWVTDRFLELAGKG